MPPRPRNEQLKLHRPHVTLEGTLLDEVDKGPATPVPRYSGAATSMPNSVTPGVRSWTRTLPCQLAVSPSDHDVARRNESGELGDGRPCCPSRHSPSSARW